MGGGYHVRAQFFGKCDRFVSRLYKEKKYKDIYAII